MGPKKEVKEKSWGQFLYDSSTGEVLSRTGGSWARIGFFYLCYYLGLAAFFAALLAIFLNLFTDDKAPTLTGPYSKLPPNPGLGFQPMPIAEKTLIKFKANNLTDSKSYIEGLQTYLETGQAPDRPASSLKKVSYVYPDVNNTQDCDDPSFKPGPVSRDTKPCVFDATKTGFTKFCEYGNFGYGAGEPCVAIKMNRIYEYVPKLKEGTGEDIQIKCEGEHIADKDNIGTPKYWPAGPDGNHGIIKTHFFPFLGQPGYMTPHVFVQLKEIQHNVLVQVVCYPTNIEGLKQDKDKQGKVHFEVFVEK